MVKAFLKIDKNYLMFVNGISSRFIIWRKTFIAFSNKQFCENWRPCNFYAKWLRKLISFLNDVDIYNYTIQYVLKILKQWFFILLKRQKLLMAHLLLSIDSDSKDYFCITIDSGMLYKKRYERLEIHVCGILNLWYLDMYERCTKSDR